jgi:thiamine-phosphate pyrophosphorylase
VTDRDACRGDLAEAVARAVRGGVDWVQVRDRSLAGAELLALVERVGRAARDAAAGRALRLIVNRRVDVALACAADGVHLGFDAMDAASARALLGPRACIGVSVHAPGEVPAPGDASYAQLAPIFAPRSKPTSRAPLGLGALAAAAARGLPLLAQGGVDADNAGDLLRHGAAGVAVTGAILGAQDPGAAAAALRLALDSARRRMPA